MRICVYKTINVGVIGIKKKEFCLFSVSSQNKVAEVHIGLLPWLVSGLPCFCYGTWCTVYSIQCHAYSFCLAKPKGKLSLNETKKIIMKDKT